METGVTTDTALMSTDSDRLARRRIVSQAPQLGASFFLSANIEPFLRPRGHLVRNVGAGGSNPVCSTIQSPSSQTYRRIAQNPRVCARITLLVGPGEWLRRRQLPKSPETYPGEILLGPTCRTYRRLGGAALGRPGRNLIGGSNRIERRCIR